MRVFASVCVLVALGACKKSEVSVPNEPTATSSSSAGGAAAPEIWRGIRWDMKLPEAMQVLERDGAKVAEKKPMKDPHTWISAKVDGWNATVYFDEKGRMNQITLIGETITKEKVDASKARITQRFGPVKETTTSAQYSFGSRRVESKGPWATLRISPDGKGTWNAHEEHGRIEANGAVGMFDLAWGTNASEVEAKLRAAGCDVKRAAVDNDHCKMPNPPPRCEESASVTVAFSKGKDNGNAAVHPKRGLGQLTFSTLGIASEADARARAKKIEAQYGAPEEIEESSMTKWSDDKANVTFELREKKPSGALSAFESYRPPGTKD